MARRESSEDTQARAGILWSRREPETRGDAQVPPEPPRARGGRGHKRRARAESDERHDSASQIAARRGALVALNHDRVPYVVAGAYAMRDYAGIYRDTKDLDLFCKRQDAGRALASLSKVGFRVEMTDPLWIAKGYADDGEYVDIIFSSGNGVAEVDDLWFTRAHRSTVLGIPALIAPLEEIIWSKSYVQERERYDGADIQHLIRYCAEGIDWRFLIERMRLHAEVLLAHILLFRFSFPGDRDRVPTWVLDELMDLCRRPALPEETGLCRGTLLSSAQYGIDLQRGLRDARPLEVPGWAEYRLKQPE